METTSAAPRRKPLLEDEEERRVVLHSFLSRADRLMEIGVHVYRQREYLDISSVELLPGGARGQVRRLSLGVHLINELQVGLRAYETRRAERGQR